MVATFGRASRHYARRLKTVFASSSVPKPTVGQNRDGPLLGLESQPPKGQNEWFPRRPAICRPGGPLPNKFAFGTRLPWPNYYTSKNENHSVNGTTCGYAAPADYLPFSTVTAKNP